jgi:hypothetical protein
MEEQMNAARSIFLNEINPTVRLQVLRAVTTEPIAHSNMWIDEDGCGCLMLTAAAAAVRESVGTTISTNMPRLTSRMLGIGVSRVWAGSKAWEQMGRRGRNRLMRDLRADRARLESEAVMERVIATPVGVIARTRTAVRDLVGA